MANSKYEGTIHWKHVWWMMSNMAFLLSTDIRSHDTGLSLLRINEGIFGFSWLNKTLRFDMLFKHSIFLSPWLALSSWDLLATFRQVGLTLISLLLWRPSLHNYRLPFLYLWHSSWAELMTFKFIFYLFSSKASAYMIEEEIKEQQRRKQESLKHFQRQVQHRVNQQVKLRKKQHLQKSYKAVSP